LTERIWPATYVDEHNLRVTIAMLRKALAHDAGGDQYIETVPKQGYRFIAPVEELPVCPISSESVEQPQVNNQAGGKKAWRYVLVGFLVVLLIGGSTLIGRARSQVFSPRILKFNPLTHSKFPKRQLVVDRSHVYFVEAQQGKVSLAEVPVTGGEVVHIPVPFSQFALLDVKSSGSDLLVAEYQPTYQIVWELPIPGGSPRPLKSRLSADATWTPNGRFVAYTKVGNRLYVANGDGTNPHEVFAAQNEWIPCQRWSPNGEVLRFAVTVTESEVTSLWEIQRDGSNLHTILRDFSFRPSLCGNWTPDQRFYVFDAFRENKWDLWAIRESSGFPFAKRSSPTRLTDGPIEFSKPTTSIDGKRVFAMGTQQDGELVRYDAKSRSFVPYLGGISAGQTDFSRDGEWVAYVAHPEGTLWRSKIDGSNVQQLTFAPLAADSPHWSPNGRLIAFRASLPGQPKKIFVLSRDGGLARELMPEDHNDEGVPTWSADGQFLVFGELRWRPEQISIHIINLETKQISDVPNSKGLWSTRWSPDGKYLLALTADALSSSSKALWVFDFHTSKWTKLLEARIGEAIWSNDGKYIYIDVDDCPKKCSIARVRFSDHNLEEIVNLNTVERAFGQSFGTWIGLDRNDSPLLLRNTHKTEVYAIDVQW
jgi:Tol biopolymer transport system component